MKASEIEYFGMLTSLRNQQQLFEAEIIITEPVLALTWLKETYGAMDTFKCPSFVAQMKNTYYITSPFDFTISKQGDEHWGITNDKPKTARLSPFFDIRMPESTKIKDSICMNLGLQYYFANNNNNIIMEVFDPPLIHLPLKNIPGQFNISKWFRPTNFTFFLNPGITTVSFKRGQPLYAVRFNTTDSVKLTKIEDLDRRERMLHEQMRGTALKDYYPGLKLEDMYELFKGSMKRLFS